MYYMRAVSHGSPETVSSEVVASTDIVSSTGDGSGGGHTFSGQIPPTTESNNSMSDEDFNKLLVILSILKSQNEGNPGGIPQVAGAAGLESETLTQTNPNIQSLGNISSTTGELGFATATEDELLPLSAAVASTDGLNFNWWYLIAIIVLGGIIYYIYRKKV